jgi:hypothetical protein
MFDTVRTIFAILREKDRPPEKLVLSLDDLCPLWIKYNSSFRPADVVKEPGESIVAGPEETVLPIPPGEDKGVQADQPASGKAIVTVQAFYNEVIEPHRESLIGVLEGINRIMELLEQYGDCPSVVDTMSDSERNEVTRIGDILSKVTLRDHTFNVTRIALRLLKETYHDPIGYIPVAIIAALGHDLGKIPELRSQSTYVKADHPRTSVSIIEGIFDQDKGAHWLKVATKVIGEHHQSATEPLSELLKEADGKARQMEIEQVQMRASRAWEEWFNFREFLRQLGPVVNVTQTGNAFRAFSHDGTVYCDPTFLYETARAMAAQRSIIDITLLRDTDKDRALRRIVESLRSGDMLTPEIGKGYTTRRYEIQVEQGKPKKMLLVPIKAGAFENQAEFEEIKTSHPPLIKGIVPL